MYNQQALFGIAMTMALFLAPSAAGLVIVVGSLSSTSPTICSANANPTSTNAAAELVVMKASYSLAEDNNRQDQWTVHLDVQWTDWPNKDHLVTPWTTGPGDKADSESFADVYANTDTFTGELSVEWDDSELLQDGAYKATATISVSHTDRTWNSEDTFQERCGASDSANIIINWGAETGGAMISFTLPGGDPE